MTSRKWLKSKNDRGSIAIIVAVSLTVLIGMLALVLDGGYLYATKDKYQNGVEAAAMAGVWHMCDGDRETVIRQIAQENGIPHTAEDGLTVHVGYYDADGLYDDFSEYEDFVADSDTSTSYNDDLSDPDEDEYEYNNAIMISLNAEVSTFLAGIFGKEEVAVSAKAVAYAERYGMLALNNDSEIRIGSIQGGVTIRNGPVYSNGNIKHTETASCPGTWGPTTYHGPQFENANLYAQNQVLECDTSCGRALEVDWDSGTPSSRENAFYPAPEFTEIEPCDDDYIDSLKDSADVIYTPADIGAKMQIL